MQLSETSERHPAAIVLAGGESARFGRLGELLHKALVPVTESQTLLSRNLDYLYESGITNVIISTSPKSFQVLEPFIDRYNNLEIKNNRPTAFCPRLIANPLHSVSSLAALNQIISDDQTGNYLMLFADMFFTTNPYIRISDLMHRTDNLIGAFPRPTESDCARGGLALIRDGECKRMFLKFTECGGCDQREIFAWSGITVFDVNVADDLNDFVLASNSMIEEDFINFCINKGRRFSAYEVDRFINVNSYSDYMEVLCSKSL